VSCYAGIQVRRHSPHGWWKQRTVHPPSASTRPAGRATGVEGGRPHGTGRLDAGERRDLGPGAGAEVGNLAGRPKKLSWVRLCFLADGRRKEMGEKAM
jgi:hypothetical protein